MGRRHLFGWKSMAEGKTASDSILTAGDFYDCRRMQNPIQRPAGRPAGVPDGAVPECWKEVNQ